MGYNMWGLSMKRDVHSLICRTDDMRFETWGQGCSQFSHDAKTRHELARYIMLCHHATHLFGINGGEKAMCITNNLHSGLWSQNSLELSNGIWRNGQCFYNIINAYKISWNLKWLINRESKFSVGYNKNVSMVPPFKFVSNSCCINL